METKSLNEFQRLKSELDKLSSYSTLLAQSQSNIQQTAQLIQNVGEKYDRIVDQIGISLQAELESLRGLRDEVVQVSEKLEQIPARWSENQPTNGAAPTELIHELNKQLVALTNRIQVKQDDILTNVQGVVQSNQGLEERIISRFTTHFNELRQALNQQLESELREVSDRLQLHAQTAPTTISMGDANKRLAQADIQLIWTGFQRIVQDQLVKLETRLAGVESFVSESLRTGLSEFSNKQPQINVPSFATDKLEQQVERLGQKLSETDLFLQSAFRKVGMVVEDVVINSQKNLSETTGKLLQAKIDPYLNAIVEKMKESDLALQSFINELRETNTGIVAGAQQRMDTLGEVINRFKVDTRDDSIESIKQISKNQTRLLLDQEKELKRQRYLIILLTLVSLGLLALNGVIVFKLFFTIP